MMRVRAKVDVRHGVTGQITCQRGRVFKVKKIIENPPCEDFVENGLEPIRGVCFEFVGMDGLVHKAECFEIINRLNPSKI